MDKKELAFIMTGHSQYDDRLWELLSDFDISVIELGNADMDGYDYAEMIIYFLLSGATVESEHIEGSTDVILRVNIDKDKEESFYEKLLNYLIEINHKSTL